MMRWATLLFAALLGAGLAPARAAGAEQQLGWTLQGELLRGRSLHTATVLEDRGSVLVVGGSDADDYLAHVEEVGASGSVERAPLGTARHSHAAVALPDGDVLVLGGYGIDRYLASVERWDADADTWTEGAPMSAGRIGHAVSLLPDGRVLVAGGYDNGVLASAELYDPDTDTWTAAPPLSRARTRATATLLPDGRVLVAGGFDAGLALADVDVFDPATSSFAPGPTLTQPRWFHAAAAIDGLVVIAGGQDTAGALASVELFDAVDLTPLPSLTLAESRTLPSLAARCDGSLVVVGGFAGPSPRASSETLDLTAGTFAPPIPTNVGRFEQTAVALPTCETLLIGGRTIDDYATPIELLPEAPSAPGPQADAGCHQSHRAPGTAFPALLVAGLYLVRNRRRLSGIPVQLAATRSPWLAAKGSRSDVRT
jgi:hypothetical protein